MDIEKLIERLNARGLSNGSSLGYHCGLFEDAADALSRLQAENEKLREKIEDARLEGYAKGIGEMNAELEQVKQKYDEAREAICTHCMDVPCRCESCYWWRGQKED